MKESPTISPLEKAETKRALFPFSSREREPHHFPSPPAEAQAEARWERVRVRGINHRREATPFK